MGNALGNLKEVLGCIRTYDNAQGGSYGIGLINQQPKVINTESYAVTDAKN